MQLLKEITFCIIGKLVNNLLLDHESKDKFLHCIRLYYNIGDARTFKVICVACTHCYDYAKDFI